MICYQSDVSAVSLRQPMLARMQCRTELMDRAIQLLINPFPGQAVPVHFAYLLNSSYSHAVLGLFPFSHWWAASPVRFSAVLTGGRAWSAAAFFHLTCKKYWPLQFVRYSMALFQGVFCSPGVFSKCLVKLPLWFQISIAFFVILKCNLILSFAVVLRDGWILSEPHTGAYITCKTCRDL